MLREMHRSFKEQINDRDVVYKEMIQIEDLALPCRPIYARGSPIYAS